MFTRARRGGALNTVAPVLFAALGGLFACQPSAPPKPPVAPSPAPAGDDSVTKALVAEGPAPPPGDARTAACRECHGPSGVSSDDGVPNLAGQKKPYLAAQLKAFKDGSRKDDIMGAITQQLRDDDIDALAAYWSNLPAGGAAASRPSLAGQSRLSFPENFRRDFIAYAQTDFADRKALKVLYANRTAWDAAREGRTLPSGSVIVSANFAAKLDGAKQPVRGKDGRLVPDRFLRLSAMESRAGWGEQVPELLRNGDWSYGNFDDKGVRDDSSSYVTCLACHKPKAADSYVFTFKELVGKAKGAM